MKERDFKLKLCIHFNIYTSLVLFYKEKIGKKRKSQ